MKKIVTALVTSAAIGVATVAGSGAAQARWWGPGPVFGGLVAGALIGTALAAPHYYYPYGYYPYYGPGPYPYRRCAWRSVWDGYRWVRACY